MQHNLNLEVPLGTVSFGEVSKCILKELYLRGIDVSIFPIGGNVDFSNRKSEPKFFEWVGNNVRDSLKKYYKNAPTFKLWHIGGSERNIGTKNHLFTFHETDFLTATEVNILKNQEKIFVSNDFTASVFKSHGVENVFVIPLGYDKDSYFNTNRQYYPTTTKVYFIGGKLERRKGHNEAIQAWVRKFGNRQDRMLHVCIYNPFLKPEENNQLIQNIFGNNKPFNVNILPFFPTNAEYNETLNACDVVMDLSRCEGWSLPSFHAVGLGKHAILHNTSGIKMWATAENAVLIEPTDKVPVYDNMFFKQGNEFNQGSYFNWKIEDLEKAFDIVEERLAANPVNEAGLELQNKFTWEKSVDLILEHLK